MLWRVLFRMDDDKLKNMRIRDFAALASETPDPDREPVEGAPFEVVDPENLTDRSLSAKSARSRVLELQDGFVLPEWNTIVRKQSAQNASESHNEDSNWRPYVGDRGGTGWTNGDEVIYDDDFTPDADQIDDTAVDEFLSEIPDEDVDDVRESLGLSGEPESFGGEWSEEEISELSNEIGEIKSMEDFDDGRWAEPPETIDSLDSGDGIGIMNPYTFEFEFAVVDEVDTDENVLTIYNGEEYLEISASDVVKSFDSEGGEAVRDASDRLSDQIDQIDSIEPLKQNLPYNDSNYLYDEFEDHMRGVDLSDPSEVIDSFREFILENNDDYRVELNNIVELSDNLESDGYSALETEVSGFDVDLPDDESFSDGVDSIVGRNDFAFERDRMIALERFAEDRLDIDDVSVPDTDVQSQKSYMDGLKTADENGFLEYVRAIDRVPNENERGDSFAWTEGNKIYVKNTLDDEVIEEYAESGVSVGADSGDILLHEIGHALHSELTEGATLPFVDHDLDSDFVRENVSDYADTNANELVAEVFLGLLKGESYPEEIIEEYNRLSGPEFDEGNLPDELLKDDHVIDMVREQSEHLPAEYAEEAIAVADLNSNRSNDKEKEWVPYEGDRGGIGWQNTDDPNDVRYTDLPPGDVPQEVLDEAGVDSVEELVAELTDADPQAGPIGDVPDAGPTDFAGGIAAAIDDSRSDFHDIRNSIVGADSREEAIEIIQSELSDDEIREMVEEVEYQQMMREEYDEIDDPSELAFGQEVLYDADRPKRGTVEDVDPDGTVWIDNAHRDVGGGVNPDFGDLYADPDYEGATGDDFQTAEPGRYGVASNDDVLSEPFEYADEVVGSREAGIEGGNTTGDKMKVLEMGDGSRVYATPIDAYPGHTGVVDSREEARRNNLNAPKIIEELGGSTCKTDITEGPDGDEYITKEHVKGKTARRSVSQEINPESAVKTSAAAYFVGNVDLHGGNMMIDEDGRLVIIDHDSGTYSGGGMISKGSVPDINHFHLKNAPSGDVYDRVFELAEEIKRGERDFGDISREHSEYIDDAADKAIRAGYVNGQYEVDEDLLPDELQSPPDGIEDISDMPNPPTPSDEYEIEYVDSSGDIVSDSVVENDPDGEGLYIDSGWSMDTISDPNRIVSIPDDLEIEQ